jgi:predicted Fe-Mo cluster-binding NifX family protein
MKIAAVTDNGTTISSHFGKASEYIVAIVEDGNVIRQERRNKLPLSADIDPHAHAVTVISDCDIVLARGMGRAMYDALQQANIRPILTKVAPITTAVTACIEGRLKDHPELVH